MDATAYSEEVTKSKRSHADSSSFVLRYHYEKPAIYLSKFGDVYECEHPVYNVCTLFKMDSRGLAVIQQRYDSASKTFWWGPIDPWLTDDLYLHIRFRDFFNERAGECTDGLYPTVTVRQIMWALKMKPLPRERWETCFDRRLV